MIILMRRYVIPLHGHELGFLEFNQSYFTESYFSPRMCVAKRRSIREGIIASDISVTARQPIYVAGPLKF